MTQGPCKTRRLFVDDYHISRMVRLKRTMHQVDKHPANPVIKPDRPWEGDLIWAKNSTVYDAPRKKFQLWYNAGKPTQGCYGESSDGVHWDKPVLGLVEYQGSKQNNLVTSPVFQVIHGGDDFGQPASDHLYQSINWSHEQGVHLMTSSDGQRWSVDGDAQIRSAGDTFIPVKSTRPLTGDDRHGLPGYPSSEKMMRYLGVVRWCMPVAPFDGSSTLRPLRRVQTLMNSPDLRVWQNAARILTPDELDDRMAHDRIAAALADGSLEHDHADDHRCEFYTLLIVPYEDLYIGLLMVFDAAYEFSRIGKSNQAGPCHTQLVASRDLYEWQRLGDRQPFIPRGGPGEFDWGVVAYCSLPVVKDDKLWFFYTGATITHAGQQDEEYYHRLRQKLTDGNIPCIHGIGLATLRRDGFISLDAGSEPGYVITPPFHWPERGALHLNIDARGGDVYVSVLQPDGTPYHGREQSNRLTGDQPAGVVTWPNGPAQTTGEQPHHTHATEAEAPSAVTDSQILAPGQWARLKITVRNAKLYAFWFAM